VPPIECFVRGEYMRQHKDGFATTYPCVIFGMASIPGQVPLFHFLMEDGGIWWRMPISAFCHKTDAPALPLSDLVLWDSFSRFPSVTRFELLANKRVSYRSRSNTEHWGTYLFTIDWCAPDGTGFAETPGQHKCGHVLALDDGNYAIQPNNRVLVFEPSYTPSFGKPVLERLVSDRIYSVEVEPKWLVDGGARYDTPTVEHDPAVEPAPVARNAKRPRARALPRRQRRRA
jgi:hypothetical protein